jgi:hypothetical protein
MKTIYILLTRSETIVSRAVYMVTADPYTHASIGFEVETLTFYSSSRKNGRTMFPAGPCAERLNHGYWHKHPKTPCALYMLQVEEEVHEAAMREVERILEQQDLYHYNICGLLLCKFNIPWRRKHHFFCSEFVSEILERSNAIEMPKETSLMRPMDYANMPQMQCLYRGTVQGLRRKCARGYFKAKAAEHLQKAHAGALR